MALDTYDGLKQSIIDHLDRDDLAGFVDDYIDIAESAHRDDVRFREILSRGTLTLAADARTVALPSDFNAMKYIRILDANTNSYNGNRYLPDLVQLTEAQLTQISRNIAGAPTHYAINEQIEFNRAADIEYTGDILYYKVMTPLSTSNQSNELLVRAPETYLYGALVASAPFLMDDERIVTWATLYRNAVDRVVTRDGLNTKTGPMVSRVAAVVP